MFRRGKVILFCASFLALMVFVFVACRNDLNLEQPYSDASTKPLSKEVIEFKEAFEVNYHFDASKIEDANRFGKIEPIWSQAITENGVLEVPIMMNKKLTLPSLYKGLSNKGKQRLVMYGKSEKSAMFIMNLMPWEGFQMKDVNTLNYRKKSFDGLISIFTENGKSLGGYLFNKGTLTKKMKRIPPNAPESCTCAVSSYDCYCGTVNGGELQCSTCYMVECYGDCGSGGIDDEDPCSGSNPPSYCGSDDPCSSSSPPPYCNGGNGCNDPDPCACDPNGPGCNTCSPCTSTYGEAALTSVWFDLWATVATAVADFRVQVTGANCTQQTFSEPTIYAQLDNWWWGKFDRANEYKNTLRKERINPNDAGCGFNLVLSCGGQATFEFATGPYGGIPIVKTWGPMEPTLTFD